MILWMLTRLEENPNAVFYGKELQGKFPEAFGEAKKAGLLRRLPATSYPSYHTPFGSRLLVLENNGRLEGIDEGDPEADPIPLLPDDLAHYTLDLDVFAKAIQNANGLSGKAHALDNHLFFLGESDKEGALGAYLLALVNDSPDVKACLSSVPNALPRKYVRIYLACPSYAPTAAEERLLEELEVQLLTMRRSDGLLPIITVERGQRRPVNTSLVISDKSVTWRGQLYPLTPQQLAVIRILYEARQRGVMGLSWPEIHERLEALKMYPVRMRDVSKGRPPFGTLVKRTGKDFYYLDL